MALLREESTTDIKDPKSSSDSSSSSTKIEGFLSIGLTERGEEDALSRRASSGLGGDEAKALNI